MNLITKLLMENEVEISAFEVFRLSDKPGKGLVISIKNLSYNEELPGTKKELLSEVPEQFYVSELEWMLLNHWKDNGADSIIADEDRDISIWHGPSDNDFDEFYQGWQKEKLFEFLEKEKEYKLDDLISRCALIEG